MSNSKENDKSYNSLSNDLTSTPLTATNINQNFKQADLVESDKNNKLKVKGDDLTPISTFSYSIGHFQNDICASCWFNFMGYYCKYIRKMDEDGSNTSGIVLLSGQVADALATPLVGILSDKFDCRFGKRTPWYVGGTILATICFILIFQVDYILPKNISKGWELLYFIVNPSLFNVGWASVQVAHMSLLPCISLSRRKQDSMTRMRTGFTFTAQLISLILSLIFFSIIDDDNILQYSVLSLTYVGLGIISSAVFLIYCKETVLSKNIKLYYDNIRLSINERNNLDNCVSSSGSSDTEREEEVDKQFNDKRESEKKIIDWKYWMAQPEFYYYMLVYMFVRLAINVSGTMIPFYCKNILNWKNEKNHSTPVEISIFFILSNLGSVCNSVFFEKIILSYFSKANFRVGLFSSAVLVISLGCLPLYFLNEQTANYAYPLAFLFGSGFSMGLSGASSLMNDVVGSYGSKGAFVYGAYSFADKISCGIVMYFMMQIADKNITILTIFMSFFPPLAILSAFSCVVIRKIANQKLKNIQDEKLVNKKKKHYGTILDNSILTFV